MCASGRLFLCARCRKPVVICSRCDRGNRYCDRTCAWRARHDAQRAAARRYCRSRRGQRTHAARQARYRARQREKVTHQGSPPSPSDPCSGETPSARRAAVEPVGVRNPASLPAALAEAARIGLMRCARCGRECSALVRQGVLRRPPRCARSP